MSKFAGMSDDVAGVVLVGAEGCAEAADEPWLRDATEAEPSAFKTFCHELIRQRRGEKEAEAFNFADFTIDGTGRPYWVKAVLRMKETPAIAIEKAEKYTRVLRVHVSC